MFLCVCVHVCAHVCMCLCMHIVAQICQSMTFRIWSSPATMWVPETELRYPVPTGNESLYSFGYFARLKFSAYFLKPITVIIPLTGGSVCSQLFGTHHLVSILLSFKCSFLNAYAALHLAHVFRVWSPLPRSLNRRMCGLIDTRFPLFPLFIQELINSSNLYLFCDSLLNIVIQILGRQSHH